MGKVTLGTVIEASGVHPKIVDFAVFNGFRLPSSDLTCDERFRKLVAERGLNEREALLLMGEMFRDEVAEFYNEKFPVVRVA